MIGLRRLAFLISVILFSPSVFSQTVYRQRDFLYVRNIELRPETRKHMDSLIRLTKGHPLDTNLVLTYYELSKRFHQTGSDSTLLYARHTLDLANQLNYVKGMLSGYSAIGDYYGTMGSGQLEIALENYLAMASLAEKLLWTDAIYDAYNTLNNLYFYTGDFPAAMRLTLKGLSLAEKQRDRGKIAYFNNLLGFIYLRQYNPTEARQYYQQYYDEAASIGDSVKMLDAQIGLAEVLASEGKSDEALQSLTVTLSVLEDLFNQKAPTLMKSEKIPYTRFAIARILIDKGNYKQALDYCRQGFEFLKTKGANEYDLANYFIIMGQVHEGLMQFTTAIHYYREGLNLALRIKHAEDIRDAYRSLAGVFARQQKFDSAFHYERLFNSMKDSIVNVRTRSEIERINSEYDVAKKDQEIEQQRQLHQAEIERQNLIRNAWLVGVLLVAVISVLLYNRYRLKEQYKFRQQFSEQRAELLGNFINTQNLERSRLARDIHDQVGTILSAAKLKLSDLEETIEGQEKEKLLSSISIMDQAAESLRSISHNLMPASISRLGLVVALDHFFNQLKQISAIKISFTAFNFTERLNENMEINLYPIVLELANNAIRHALANNLTIQIIRYPDRVNITVEDDGAGFDYHQQKKRQSGLGLPGIESRIEILKGTFNLDSTPGRGTVAMVDVPI